MLGLGLLFTFAPDLTWELQHLSNSLDGEASERSEAWEFKRKLWAGLSLVLGGLLIFISFQG